ncbi:MAG: hypothetical protein ACJ8HI_12810 [Massilia sp.]
MSDFSENTMRTVIVALALAAGLMGCTTPQQRAQKEQAEMDLKVIEHGPACTQVGFTPNTDPWRQCVLQQAANAEANKPRVSTSIFAGWENWWPWGRGSGGSVGLGVGVGR